MEGKIIIDKATFKVLLNTMFMAGTNFGLKQGDNFSSVCELSTRRDAESIAEQKNIFKILKEDFEEGNCGEKILINHG